MKNTDTSWRFRSDPFNLKIKRKGKITPFKMKSTKCRKKLGLVKKLIIYLTIYYFGLFTSAITLNLQLLLLQIAGIEQNPGPEITEIYGQITYKLIEFQISATKNKNFNEKQALSVWGYISSVIFGSNEYHFREFLKEYHSIFSLNTCKIFEKHNDPDSCKSISPWQIKSTLKSLNVFSDNLDNFLPTQNIWIQLASVIFNSDKRYHAFFLYSLWKLYFKLEKKIISDLLNETIQPSHKHPSKYALQEIQKVLTMDIIYKIINNNPNLKIQIENPVGSTVCYTSWQKIAIELSKIYPFPGIQSNTSVLKYIQEFYQQNQPNNHLCSSSQSSLLDRVIHRLNIFKLTKKRLNQDNPTLNTIADNSSEIQEPEQQTLSPALLKLKEKYEKDINIVTSFTCKMCNILLYQFQVKHFQFKNDTFIRKLNLEGLGIKKNEKIECCNRCWQKLKKQKIPPRAIINNMDVPLIPDELKCLTEAESSLIKQVKMYFKIITLNKGQGQLAARGTSVHFPLDIEEVTDQLPLNDSNIEMIIINETTERVEHIREFQISPERLRNALIWLKNNNQLYFNINFEVGENYTCRVISPVSEIPSNIRNVIIPENDNLPYGYRPLTQAGEILRASFSQCSSFFNENFRGKQCVGMTGSFICYASLQPPSSWVRNTIDEILILGDKLYTNVQTHGEYLLPEQLNNCEVEVFGSQKVRLEVLSVEHEFHGFLKKAKPLPHLTLDYQLQAFIDSQFNYAVLTTFSLSMGVIKDENFVYFTDSHRRSPQGIVSNSESGVACVLKFPREFAATFISKKLHRILGSYDLFKLNPITEAEKARFYFTISPVLTHRLVSEDAVEDNLTSQDSFITQQSKRRRVDSESSSSVTPDDEENDDDSPYVATSIVNSIPTINPGVSDSVMYQHDFLEPEKEQIIPPEGPIKFDFSRRSGPPISERTEENLEMLSFPKLFPTGRNGRNEPRKIPITTLDYYQARLMSAYKRFSSTPEYMFYALDQTDKARINEKIGIVAKLNHESNGTNDNRFPLGTLDPNIYMSAIRGESAYWKRYNGDILAMINHCGSPHLFFTISYDDLNSTDVLNAMYYAQHRQLPDPERVMNYQERVELLRKNPIAAARHFNLRLGKFIAILRDPVKSNLIFGRPIKDFTKRVEFQNRGSPHAHMLLWVENPPDFESDEGRKWIDENVSCSLNTPYRELVMKYQYHNCRPQCFKKNKTQCRFHYPRPPCERTTVLPNDELERTKGRLVVLKRTTEESRVNNYHPKLLPILRCNMDIQVITNSFALAYYIAKYISKGEPTELRQEIADSIEKIQNSNLPEKTKMQRVALTILRNREVSAQEAAFRTCGLCLRHSSRAIVFVPAFRKHLRLRMLNRASIETDSPQFCTNIIDRYMNRPDELEHLCLYEFASMFKNVVKKSRNEDEDLFEDDEDYLENDEIGARKYKLKRNLGTIAERKKTASVKIPRFDPLNDSDAYYYSLILMYRPFRIENFCDNISPKQFFQNVFSELRTHENNEIINWKIASELESALLRVTDLIGLGEDNEIDNPISLEYEIPEDLSPLSQNEIFQEQPRQDIGQLVRNLTQSQKVVYEDVVQKIQDQNNNTPLLMHISGGGGCGKSWLIKLITLLLNRYYNNDSTVLLTAPTGKAAFNINGVTLHRAFALGVELGKMAPYYKLSSDRLQQMRSLYKNTKLIIIDEISMVSYETLRQIHLRLTEIFNNEEPFGGVSVMLVGDLMQLKPCNGSWIFQKPERWNAELNLWRIFKFYELQENKRHTSGDPLLGICNRLRVAQTTTEDLAILMTRILNPLNAEMVEYFKDAVYGFPTVDQVNKYNESKIKEQIDQGVKIYNFKSINMYEEGNAFGLPCPTNQLYKSRNKNGGLEETLQLGLGSKVMVCRNLDTPKGIVNGSCGEVVGFIWNHLHRDQMFDGELPLAVAVKFNHKIPGSTDNVYEIPVRSSIFLSRKRDKVRREQIPLILSWAVTFHKMQGDTYTKVCVDLGPKVFAEGQLYVAISRAKTLAGLAIIQCAWKKLTSTEKYKPCSTPALNELERLRKTVTANTNS